MRFRFLLLAIIMFGVGLSVTADWDRSHRLRHVEIDLRSNRDYLAEIRKHLHDFYNIHKRYPTNDEGLRALQIKREDQEDFDLHISRFITPTGDVLSIWGEPIIYENRRGLPAERFRDSGATKDRRRLYSLQVDKDVYIWSLAAPQFIAAYHRDATILVGLYILFYGSAFLLLLFWLRSGRDPSRRLIHRFRDATFHSFAGGLLMLVLGPIVALLISPLTGNALGKTCYDCYAPLSPDDRSPALTKQYLELTEKYHKRGIISEATYRKTVEAMKSEKER